MFRYLTSFLTVDVIDDRQITIKLEWTRMKVHENKNANSELSSTNFWRLSRESAEALAEQFRS